MSAFVDSITVNKQQAHVTGSTYNTPVVPGVNPVIRWEYVNSIADIGQAEFEIRISTSSTNWGDDAFVGDTLQENIQSGSNFFDYDDHNLARGIIYYGQVQALDTDNDKTPWGRFVFQTNRLPLVTGARLSPENPSSAVDVELDYTFTDADSHSQSGTKIRWFRNGFHQARYDDVCILPSSATASGDSWNARIIPSDGLEFGQVAETDAVDIQSLSFIDPTTGLNLLSNVKILPNDANVDDILKVEFDIFETEYVSVEENIVIEWYVNDELTPNSNQQFIRLKLEPDDEVYVIVKIINVQDETEVVSVQSDIKIIKDVVWHLFNLEISGLRRSRNLPDTQPVLHWQKHKTTAGARDTPTFFRVLINKTESLDSTVFDTGFLSYRADTYQIPSGVLKRGQSYYFHAAVGDTDNINDNLYETVFVRIAGSSWELNVDNATGWTVEFQMRLPDIGNIDSAFINPFDINTDPDSNYQQFETSLQKWNINIQALAILPDVLGAEVIGQEEGLETKTIGGIVVTRKYPGPRYTGQLLSGASNPFDALTETDAHDFWKKASDAYTEMDIDRRIAELAAGSEVVLHIHDGSYFASIGFGLRSIRFTSKESVLFEFPADRPNSTINHIYRIEGQGTNCWIYLDNVLVLTLLGSFNSTSNMRELELGDFDSQENNTVILCFFRYSTEGIRGTDNVLQPPNDTFFFTEVAKLKGGSVETVVDTFVVWTPDDVTQSSKILQWMPEVTSVRLPAANRSFSPITAIHIDNQRNKYIGTANGITAIYGEKHDPDYFLDTTGAITISPVDFDRISNVDKDRLLFVEQNRIIDWFSINTTFQAVQFQTTTTVEDPYDPYIPDITGISSHAIHYFSQRTHGHSWYDNVDNNKGWSIGFSFFLETLEADDRENVEIEHHGFGFYVNDGKYQEVLYFYEDRIRLFYANVFVPINTTLRRDYVVVGQGNNLLIYQKSRTSPVGTYQLLLDGKGLFTTSAALSGNSRNPKVVLGPDGNYHAVWHDDGNRRSQILYSLYDGTSWSVPEVVTESSQFDLRFPDVDVDSLNRVWVVYEDTSWGPVELSVSVKDEAGWNPKLRLTNSPSEKGKPSIKIDSVNDVHIVWEDKRNGHSEIFWAHWQDITQAWNSSGQFGEDTIVVQFDELDPYQSDNVIEFKNPKLALLHPRLWLVFEGHQVNINRSIVYRSFRDLELNFWASSGVVQVNTDGEAIGAGQSYAVSPSGRNCLNPSITSNPTRSLVCIAWEDQTEPVSQIWGRVYSTAANPIIDATQITSQTSNCNTPSVGSVGSQFVIVHERGNKLFTNVFSQVTNTFIGSSTGGTDQEITVDNLKSITQPFIVPIDPAKSFLLVYEFIQNRSPSQLETVEFPDFSLIGDAVARENETVISSVTDGMVSSLDTKEFAFGDFSETVGMIAHWRNIEIYFGYNARPHAIANFNRNTVDVWPDNRINDIFVDVFGNIIAGTFSGLIYHNVFNGESVVIDRFDTLRVNAVKWAGSGNWYVAHQNGVSLSPDAGKTWTDLITGDSYKRLAINKNGILAVGGKDVKAWNVQSPDQVLFDSDDFDFGGEGTPSSDDVRALAIDDKNIIWVGTKNGLYRIDGFSLNNHMRFSSENEMRSSYVNDIVIIGDHLRYIATPTGIEKMHGSRFVNLNVHTHNLLNDNVFRLQWDAETSSLWAGTAYQLHEIVFRDPAHEIVLDETAQYNALDLLTEPLVERDKYFVVDPPPEISHSEESSDVFINRNPLDFGFTIDDTGTEINFLCNLLLNDQIEVKLSDAFHLVHDFNQLQVERDVFGDRRTIITKIQPTSIGEFFYLAAGDRSDILLDAGSVILPFDTIMLDLEKPFGCIKKTETISRTQLRFTIVAFDQFSGVDSFMLSNFSNFTSDGETPLNFQPIKNSVVHDIGTGLDNVLTSLQFPTTVVINGETRSVGTGAKIGIWVDEPTFNEHLIAVTSRPVVVFKYDPVDQVWNAIQAIDPLDNTRAVTSMRTIETSLYITTRTSLIGGKGDLRRMSDGVKFETLAQVDNEIAQGLGDSGDLIFFGTGNGDIFSFNPVTSMVKDQFSNIGESIQSMDVYRRTLFVGTSKEREHGTQGQLFSIDIDTSDNLPEFVKSGTVFNDVLVNNKGSDPIDAFVYLSGRDLSEIYRASLEDRNFLKSYTSFDATVNRVATVDANTIDRDNQTGEEFVLASVGPALLHHAKPSWEFVFRHDEDINDFVQFTTDGEKGIWVISDSKIVRWTQIKEDATKTIFLRLRDKAGNLSDIPDVSSPCPYGMVDNADICCSAYSIRISDLQNFINESRIIDVNADGGITFSYDSTTGNPIYSGDRIDIEQGIYVSEIFNGSANLVAWRSIAWASTQPQGTSITVQVRSGVSEDEAILESWSQNLEPDSLGVASIEHITDQYLQFRVILESRSRDLSPTLSSVTLRNITTQASHFFTTNFVLPSRPIKGLLTANTFVPVSSDIIFGINTKNTTDFADYQIIDVNRLFSAREGQFEPNLRIGARLLSPSVPAFDSTSDDPYNTSTYICSINFAYENIDSVANDYHFRIKFFNDPARTQLIHTFFSGNDQTGWQYEGGPENVFPATGLTIGSGATSRIIFEPLSLVEENQTWYLIVDAFNGEIFETVTSTATFVCANCFIVNDPGLIAEYYKTGLADLTAIPTFSVFTPDHIIVETEIDFPLISGQEWTTSTGTILEGFATNFAARYRGRIQAPSNGTYNFFLQSDDGARLFIDGVEIIDNDGIHLFTEESASLNLSEGFHEIEVHYFQSDGDAGLVLKWTLPGQTQETVVPPERLFHAVTSEYCVDTSTPRILNFAVMFEMEGGELVKLNT